jgi:hypothetical protein
MAQSLSFTEGVNITPDDVEKCSEKLSNFLDTSPAWHTFRIYLELKDLGRHFRTSGKSATHSCLRQKKATTTHNDGDKDTCSQKYVKKISLSCFLFLVISSVGPRFCKSDIFFSVVSEVHNLNMCVRMTGLYESADSSGDSVQKALHSLACFQ